MRETPAQKALAASSTALLTAVACVLLFVPPLLQRYLDSPVRMVAVALVLATAVLLHWAFLGIALRRLERPALGFLALSVLLFPIGGAAALILLSWADEPAHDSLPAPVGSR